MKSNKSLRLSTSTSIQAIAAQARRAAAITAVERKLKKASQAERPKQIKKQRILNLSQIELATRSITSSLSTLAGEGITLVHQTPGRYSSAHAIICLYSKAAAEARRVAKERHKTDPAVRVPKLYPTFRYVLYPSAVDNSRLGSVAIYCDNTVACQASIAKAGHLFGFPVKTVTLEAGISPYVDVVLRG